MPAPAVIPAPIAYIKIVAVKKLVVGFLASVSATRPRLTGWCVSLFTGHPRGRPRRSSLGGVVVFRVFYFEKIRVFKAGLRCEYISME